MYLFIYLYLFNFFCIYIHMYMYMYMYMYVCVYIWEDTFFHTMYVFRKCVYIFMCMCMWVCISSIIFPFSIATNLIETKDLNAFFESSRGRKEKWKPDRICTIALEKILLQNTLAWHSSLATVRDILAWRACGKLLWGHSCGTLLRDTLVKHSFLTLLLDILVAQSGKALSQFAETLLKDTFVRHSCLTHLEHLAVLLSTTKRPHNISQYYLVHICDTKLARYTSHYDFVIQSWHTPLPSISLYYRVCTEYFPVPHSLRNTFPSTALCYKGYTKVLPSITLHKWHITGTLQQNAIILMDQAKGVAPNNWGTTNGGYLKQRWPQKYEGSRQWTRACPRRPLRPAGGFAQVECTACPGRLLCITKFAQSISQYDFVLQNLHTTLSSTTLNHKICARHFPVLLCTAELARDSSQYHFVLQKNPKSISQYHFVIQSLHKTLPSTTLHYKFA